MKRGLIALTALCLVVLALFQLIGMGLGLFDSEFEINRYVREAPEEVPVASVHTHREVVIIASDADAVPAVTDACAYLRIACRFSPVIDERALQADTLVWAKPELDLDTELPALLAYSAGGGTLIMAEPPNVALVKESEALRGLLGVESVTEEQYETKGIWLYAGFLLGGEAIYQDLCPTVPWYALTPGYSVYLSGLTAEKVSDAKKNVPLLWRTRGSGGFVFAMCENLLTTHRGAGFFTAMLSKVEQPFLYPVVNAQTMMVQNFPFLASENETVVRANYHQTSDKLFFNAILPNATAIFAYGGYPLNCLMSGALSSGTPDALVDYESLKLYIRLIVGRSGEMGVSGYDRETNGAFNLTRNLRWLKTQAPAYGITVFAPNGMAEEDYLALLQDGQALERIQTLILPLTQGDMQPCACDERNVLYLPVTHDGFSMDDWEMLMLHSVETALLCSNISVDTRRVLYPESADDDWALLNKRWSDALSEAWYPYRELDKLVLSEADRRARVFLSGEYNIAYTSDGLTIRREDASNSVQYFVLRGEDLAVERCEGGTAKRLEAGAYLIGATASEVRLTLKYEHSVGYRE